MENQELIDLERALIANLSSLRTSATRLGDIARINDLDAQLAAAEARLVELEAQ
jgi:hypothetical protein